MIASTVLAIRHVPHEDLGLLAEGLAAAGIAIDYRDVYSGNLRHFEPSDFAGLIVMGGPMSANDADHDRLLALEIEWLHSALRANMPVLGICLGAQLLARAGGARVYRNRVKEIGWGEIEFTSHAHSDPLFSGSAGSEMTFHWHGETFDLPEGAVLLASSAACRHQAFRLGSQAWGLQFHCELTPSLLEQWISDDEMCADAASPVPIDLAAVVKQGATLFPSYTDRGRKIVSRFASLVVQRASTVAK